MEKVLEDHNLPQRLARFMPEDRVSEIADTMDELFGLHPPSWTLVRQTTDTILRLAELGNVIVIGRGATVITGKLDHVFHVRLVGSLEKRVSAVQELNHSARKRAWTLIRREDRGRQALPEGAFQGRHRRPAALPPRHQHRPWCLTKRRPGSSPMRC